MLIKILKELICCLWERVKKLFNKTSIESVKETKELILFWYYVENRLYVVLYRLSIVDRFPEIYRYK